MITVYVISPTGYFTRQFDTSALAGMWITGYVRAAGERIDIVIA